VPNQKQLAETYGVLRVFEAQISATRALLKFCKEHNPYNSEAIGVNNDVYSYVKHIELCLKYFEENDASKALSEYEKVPFGGNGCLIHGGLQLFTKMKIRVCRYSLRGIMWQMESHDAINRNIEMSYNEIIERVLIFHSLTLIPAPHASR